MFCRILGWKAKGLVGLFGLFMLGMAAVAALVAFVVVVLAALAAIASVAAAIVGYVKRETWTLPAYRWARDKSGGWGFTPWSGGAGEPGTGAPAGEGTS